MKNKKLSLAVKVFYVITLIVGSVMSASAGVKLCQMTHIEKGVVDYFGSEQVYTTTPCPIPNYHLNDVEISYRSGNTTIVKGVTPANEQCEVTITETIIDDGEIF